MTRRRTVDEENPIIRRIREESPKVGDVDGADPRDLLHVKHKVAMWKAGDIYRVKDTGLKARCHTPENSKRPRITEPVFDDWYYNEYLKQPSTS